MSLLKKRIAYLTTSTLLASSVLGITPCLFASSTPSTITYNFDGGTEGWIARGDAQVTTTSSSLTIDSTNHCLYVTNRTSNWHGVSKELKDTLKAGETYTFSVYVKYDEGADTESLSLTLETGLEENGYITIASNSAVSKGEWTQLTGEVTVPEAATKANVYMEAANADLSFYVDELKITGSFATDSPEVPNAPLTTWDFESGLGDWSVRGSGEATAEVSTTTPHGGNQCAFVSGRTQDWNGIQVNLTNSAKKGGKYTFEAWVKYDAADEGTEQFVLALQYDAESESSTQYKWITNADVKNGEWTKLQGEYTLPKDFTDISLYIQVNGSTIDFYADDITMQGEPERDIEIQKDIPSLKDVYSDYFKFGTAIASNHLNDLEQELVLKHFNSITHENALKPESILDHAATIAYMNANGDQTHPQVTLSSDAKATLDFARDNHIPVRAHVLVWHSQTPNWLFTENYSTEKDAPVVSKEVMKQRLENYTNAYFKLLSEEYPDVDFYAIDVVNEAVNPDRPDGLRAPATVATTSGDDGNDENANNSMWMTTIGAEYIEDAFTYARAAADQYMPNIKLAYNDYNECDPKKAEIIYNICKDLYDKGLLDVVGMQAHYNMTSPSTSQFENALLKYASIGDNIEIQITELDITQEDTSEEGLIKQAYRYKGFLDIMKKLDSEGSANITSCVMWGVKDDESWRSERLPLLFDADYQAKPSFWAITDSTKLPVLAQEVKAYSLGSKDYTHAFLIQKGTALETTSGTQIASYKVAWDTNNIYVNVIPTEKGKSGTVKVFVDDNSISANLTDNTVIQIPLSEAVSEGGTLSFDLFVQVGDEKATWNNLAYDGTSTPNKSNFGKLLLSKAPHFASAIKGTPIIDGKIDELWSKAETINVDTFSVGTSGATATAKALWDENYVYVLMEVKDSLLSKASANTYEQDSVEIFIDEDNAKSTSYELGDIQYRVNFDNERSINGASDADSFMTATQIIDGGYIVEAALPSRIAAFTKNQVIGFDFQINDDADGNGKRDNVSNWNDLTGNGWSSTAGYGVLQLIKPTTTDDSGSGSGSGTGSSSTSTSTTSVNKTPDQIIASALSDNTALELFIGTTPITISQNSIEQLSTQEKALVLKSGKVTATITPAFINTNLSNANKILSSLEVSMLPVSDTLFTSIKNQLAKDDNLSIVGTSANTSVINIKGHSSLSTFTEPLLLSVDLENATITDSSHLTLARVSENTDGTFTFTQLGGDYQLNTHTLTGYVTEPGTYIVIEKKNLIKLNLIIGKTTINSNQSTSITNDTAPKIVNGTTMVPLRFVAEQLGADVKWNAVNKEITLLLDNQKVILNMGKGQTSSNPEAILENGRTLVPLRYVSENLGANVLWIPSSKTIEIVK